MYPAALSRSGFNPGKWLLGFTILPLERVEGELIEETWKRLERRVRIDGASEDAITNMRQAFVGALYATAAAMTVERFDAQDVSQTAFKIEMQKSCG